MTEIQDLKANVSKTQNKLDFEEQQKNHYKTMAGELAE
jgi:hypothetical protein